MNTITTLLEDIIDQAGAIGVEAEALPDAYGAEAEQHLRSALQALDKCREALRRPCIPEVEMRRKAMISARRATLRPGR